MRQTRPFKGSKSNNSHKKSWLVMLMNRLSISNLPLSLRISETGELLNMEYTLSVPVLPSNYLKILSFDWSV